MADTISTNYNLSIEIPAYKIITSESGSTSIDSTVSKNVTLTLPNPKKNLTETEIKSAVNTFIRQATDSQNAAYYFEDNEADYTFQTIWQGGNFSTAETAYTTNQTIRAVDIGFED